MGSRVIELSEVITDIAAGPFGSNLKVSCFVPDGFPIIDGANLKGLKVTDNLTKFVTEEKARSLSRSIAKRGEVIVTISGTLGQIAYIPDDSLFPEYLCSQRQFRVAFDASRVYVPYLVYYFHTREGQAKILSFANQTGVPALAQPTKNFKRILVELPEIEEQKRIAKCAELLTDKIELNNRLNDYLAEIVTLRFMHDFGDLFAQDASHRVGDYMKLERGLSYKGKFLSDAGTPMLNLGNIMPGNAYREEKLKYYTGDFKVKNQVHYHDILIANTDLTQAREVIGSAILVPQFEGDVIYSHHLSAVRDLELPTYFMLEALKTPFFRSRAAGFATGTTVLALPKDAITDMPFEVPSAQAMNEFEHWASPFIMKQEENRLESKKLENLRDALLPKLMSGEIDVSKVDITQLNNHLA